MGKKLMLDKTKLTELVDKKMKISDIAKEFNVSRDCIMSYLREYGIDFTECMQGNRKYKFNMDKHEMERYLDMHLTYGDIAKKWEQQTGERVPDYVVSAKGRSYGLISEGNRYYMRRDNPACREEVRGKISQSVKELWQSGAYDSRINGMTGCTEDLSAQFLPEGCYAEYAKKARFYHPEGVCLCCGKQLNWNASQKDKDAIEVHHVDRNHDNYSLTNLMPVCRSCHRQMHDMRSYFTTVTKEFAFDAAHYLPYHDGKCKFIHGHTYHMAITVRNVIDLGSGMVMDFSKLKDAVNDNVLAKFDHGFLNEYIPYSTCECMIFWIWRELSRDVKGLYKIKLQETDGSYAELTAEDYAQCLPQFECAWHYSKGLDNYTISNPSSINNGTSPYFKDTPKED